MFLTTRNPDVLGLTNRVNRLLSDTLGSFDWQLRDSATAAWVPPVDILEEADAIRIMAEVPGIDPKDVKISVEGNVLTIHGTKQQVAEERTERVHRYERSEEHTSELQSRLHLVCRLLLEKKKKKVHSDEN